MGLRCVNIRVIGGGIEVIKSILSALRIDSVAMSDKSLKDKVTGRTSKAHTRKKNLSSFLFCYKKK
jgi:hypothetical protein